MTMLFTILIKLKTVVADPYLQGFRWQHAKVYAEVHRTILRGFAKMV